MSHYPRDTVYREDHNQTGGGNGPLRLKGINKIKETTEWVAGDCTQAFHLMAT